MLWVLWRSPYNHQMTIPAAFYVLKMSRYLCRAFPLLFCSKFGNCSSS
jgi:hypothetical protein